MQNAVQQLIGLGTFPDEDAATAEQVSEIQESLSAIHAPVTDDEAVELVKLFGRDTCFGLAWTLLHLVETAPSWPIDDCLPEASENEWIRRLRLRSKSSPQ